MAFFCARLPWFEPSLVRHRFGRPVAGIDAPALALACLRMPPRLHPAPVVLPRAALAFALVFSWNLFAGAAETNSASSPWDDALRLEFTLAAEEFARRHAAAPDDSRIALGLASALLGRQPRTQANVLEARAILEKLATTPPADSTFTLAARLLLGRIAEDHLSPPRPDEARERYEALLRDHAGHSLADQAAVHLALLAAYPPPGAPALSPAEVHARIDQLRAAVRTPEVIRELHAIQGRLRLDEGSPREALSHLLAARAIGYRQPDRNSDADLSIANIAREAGDRATALAHYRAFLDARPRDARSTTVRRYVAELGAATAAASYPARP